MNSDDDQIWLDALAGRAPARAASQAAAEAARLRAEILARAVAPPALVPARDPRREEALIARARREGLIPARRRARRGGWTGWPAAAALAAAVTVVVIGIVMWPVPERETVRGAPGGIVHLAAEQPQELQRRIVAELRDAGVQAVTYERLGLFGIDADLPTPVPPAVAEVLRRHEIPVPADGALSVEIAQAAAR
jgi:hypothetical protein